MLIKTFFFEVVKQKKKEKFYFIAAHMGEEETKVGFRLPCSPKESESCGYLAKALVGNTLSTDFFVLTIVPRCHTGEPGVQVIFLSLQ